MRVFLAGIALGAVLTLCFYEWQWQREMEWFVRKWR